MRSKKRRGVKGEGDGEQRGMFIGGVCTKIEPGPFSKYLRGDTVESLGHVTNVTVPNPAIQSGFCLSLFVSSLFGPASFDSGVLPLAPTRKSRTAPTFHPHSPQPTRPPVLRRLSPALHSPISNIASCIPNHNTSRHVFSRAFRRCAPSLLIVSNG